MMEQEDRKKRRAGRISAGLSGKRLVSFAPGGDRAGPRYVVWTDGNGRDTVPPPGTRAEWVDIDAAPASVGDEALMSDLMVELARWAADLSDGETLTHLAWCAVEAHKRGILGEF